MATTTELQNWYNGTVTGGPNGDGYYPLTNADGVAVLTPCPALNAEPTPTDPLFGTLAFKDQVDWNTEVINKPAIGGSGSGTVTQVNPVDAAGISWTGGMPDGSGVVTLTPTLSINLQSWSGIDPADKADASHSHAATAITTDASNRFITDTLLDKLNGIEAGANNYTHPVSHSPSIITEDGTHRWFTDTERTKLAGIAVGANSYEHPASHPPSIIAQDASNRFITDVLLAKLNGIEAGANNFTYEHPATHPASMISQDADHRFVTDVQIAMWNAGGGGGGGCMAWLAVSADTPMTANIGYIVTGARTMTLPATAPVGMYAVHAKDAEVIVAHNGNLISNVGAGEDLSISAGGTALLICTTVGVLEIV